jgi:hypothetical protein
VDGLIERLNDAGVRYLLIGGQALRLHGMPRFSMDWDILLPLRDAENLRKIGAVLGDDLDLELEEPGPRGENVIQTYQTRFGVVQFHFAVPGLPSFEDAFARRTALRAEDGVAAQCLCASDLLACKRAANRPQDQQDIAYLEELLRARGD